MSKVLRETPITTRNARAKLAEGVYWRGIDPDVHLGYRKGKRGGRWVVRFYGGDQTYSQETIGTADDAIDADNTNTFDFAQAVVRARTTVKERRADAKAAAAGAPITVRLAVAEYLAARERREDGQGSTKRDPRSRLTKYVLSDEKIADLALHKLTEASLTDWREHLPTEYAAASIRRLISDFRAALNLACKKHRSRLPAHLPVIIKNGFAVAEDETGGSVARPAQVLPDADIRRIIAATQIVDDEEDREGDLVRLVTVLAATGARYSQVIRMMVGDVQIAQGRLMVPVSRKGRGTKRTDRIGVRVGQDVLDALRPAMAGRRGTDILLERWRFKQIDKIKWVKDRRGPWGASDLTRPWASIITKAELPSDIIPYALRHSSIVRGLRAGLPVRLVAALHDTSSAMIEKHYSAFIIDALDELAAAAVIPLTTAPAAVVDLATVRRDAG